MLRNREYEWCQVSRATLALVCPESMSLHLFATAPLVPLPYGLKARRLRPPAPPSAPFHGARRPR